MGSPGYTAPEIAALARDLGPKSDQWALAAIVYETLTGVPPHYDEDAVERTASSTRSPSARPSRSIQPSIRRSTSPS
jgi:serine/threonine-protein kinase